MIYIPPINYKYCADGFKDLGSKTVGSSIQSFFFGDHWGASTRLIPLFVYFQPRLRPYELRSQDTLSTMDASVTVFFLFSFFVVDFLICFPFHFFIFSWLHRNCPLRNLLLRLQSIKSLRLDLDTGMDSVDYYDNIQLSPEGEMNSDGYIPRREASRYISTALHRPWGG